MITEGSIQLESVRRSNTEVIFPIIFNCLCLWTFSWFIKAVMLSVIFHLLSRMFYAIKSHSSIMMCFNRKSTSLTPVIELQSLKQNDIGKIFSLFIQRNMKIFFLDVYFTHLKMRIKVLIDVKYECNLNIFEITSLLCSITRKSY